MILVDMNQVTISNLMIHLSNNELNENMVRHMVLNSLRSYKSKFGNDYGELVLCYDDKHYWRKEYFPNYKANRKKDRTASKLDWNELFETLNKIRDEVKEYFPYKVLQVTGAEADDIIATIVKVISETPKLFENVLIMSGDKDFIQLQKHSFVKQYSPTLKKYVNGVDPNQYRIEHIFKGDRGDGIPNILSSDNTFVEGIRQKPLSKKKIEEWISKNEWPIPEWNDELKRNYQRNKTLIDLECLPSDIFERIYITWKDYEITDRSKILQYFMKYKLRELTEKLGDF
jgi:5'-3' exonuclease